MVRLAWIFLVAMLVKHGASPQILTPPEKWKRLAVIGRFELDARLNLPHNSTESIRQELLDANTIRLIAEYNNLEEADLDSIRIVRTPESRIYLYQVGESEKAFDILSKDLEEYHRERERGHSRAFVMAGITNRAEWAEFSDPFLKAFSTKRTVVPISWMKKKEGWSGKVTTNGKELRSAVYLLIDGDIAWEYTVSLNTDGAFMHAGERRFDAKEHDHKIGPIIRTAQEEAAAEMSWYKDAHGFGASMDLWCRMKEKLKRKGIDWRSPAELNPHGRFD